MERTDNLDFGLQIAMELQSIGQNGLTYSKDPFDRERFARIREISAEIMAMKTGLSTDRVREVFCYETGYQTPKMDTRAAMFRGEQILLVEEQGKWALPGGWMDVHESIAMSTVREVKEEAGLDVRPTKIIALQDRNRHNVPPYAYGICKVFVLCQILGGSFQPNIETTRSDFFSLDELPILSENKTTADQIRMCFDAYHDDGWVTQFD